MPWRAVGLSLALAVTPHARTGAAQGIPPQAFTAATIKANLSGERGATIDNLPGGRVRVTNHTLHSLLRIVYQLQDPQIVGGPPWVATERWNITATAEANVAISDMVLMMRRLLEERFKVGTHRETREMPVYVLTVAGERPKPAFQLHTSDCLKPGACFLRGPAGDLRGVGATLVSLQRAIETATGRVVVDRTGLPPRTLYDFTLTWRPDGPGEVNDDRPSLFTAIEEQLGLRLRPDRAPVDVLVIDAAERPVED